MTPAAVHYGEAVARYNARQRVLAEAYHRHPQRFINGAPTPPSLPTAVWINGPTGREVAQ
jgi:putative transposase